MKGIPVFDSKSGVVEPIDSIVFHQEVEQFKKLDRDNLFSRYIKTNRLDSLYVRSVQIKQNSFIADFNGDNEKDIMFLVRNIINDKTGFIFFHSPKDFFVVGAGNENSALDSLFYTQFSIDRSKMAYETVIDSISGDIIEPKEIKLKNIALAMHEEEGTSGLLTWNGEKYVYIHTGD